MNEEIAQSVINHLATRVANLEVELAVARAEAEILRKEQQDAGS